MGIASDLVSSGFFQDEWDGRMVDTCVINRKTAGTLNTTTGTYTPTDTPQYSGRCYVKAEAPGAVIVGEEQVELRRYLVVIPYDEEDVAVDDVVTVTSTLDGVLDGKQLVVHNVRATTWNTARKLDCEDNQGGP